MKSRRDPQKKGGSSLFLLRLLNQLFTLGLIVAVFIAVNRYMNKPPDPDLTVSERVTGGKSFVAANRVVFDDQGKFIQYYNRISSRDIFESPWEKPQPVVEEEAPVVVEKKPPLPELQTLIRIAGIVVDGTNSQAIIEDLRAGETRFMRVGQEVHGARIAEIRDTMVIFAYDDGRVELKP